MNDTAKRHAGERFAGILAAASATLLALLGVYIAGFGLFDETVLRVGVYALAAFVLILEAAKFRFADGPARRWWWLADAALLLCLAISTQRYFAIGEELEIGLYFFTTLDVLIGLAGLAVLIVLTGRAFGPPLVVVCILALIYGLFGEYLPWIFQHGGYSLEQVMQVVWYSFDGVFGGPVSVVVTLILVFVVFGVLLEGIGAGPVLLKFAFVATGRSRGGPAHAAIVASGIFGTMSGSVSGNVVGTGVMTIPMIVKRGLPARYAGGIEAAASSGGQFMPPIMGAVAFIMSDVTGIPYLTICAAALLPALFYYGSLFVAVHLETVKRGIKPIPAAERPKLTRHDWLMSLCFVLPLALVVVIMLSGRSPALAGFWAVITTVVLGLVINPDLRRHPRRLIDALEQGGYAAARIVIAVGAIGIVIGIMNMTGLGLRFAGIMQTLAGNSLFLSLVMMMLGSLILGMGMPTVPAYLIIVLVMGPAIEMMGVPTLTAHLFVVYFGVLSSITPPVAIAAFAAASIARANPIAIGIDACRVALIGFIIPFVLIYNPSLSLVIDFTAEGFVWVCLRLGLAIWLLSTGMSGYAAARLPLWQRLARVALGVAVLLPELWLEIGATAIAMAVAGLDFLRRQGIEVLPTAGSTTAEKR
ncbi:TRAP transporter permease [Chelativorans salis]|uniref:TRAP transporter fused permease subunit n=1 Tax=Chelativorans salis TaxID=2978478 RepID=A0ABT2LTL4_9HYPH|nr:TRAP transporter fused permease subunit [Chelativorans sp. EGI FJ00035]MCT7377875.1 TRAP transporter fused permease subunit [Chelativorans sp. EGI FJ00035]